jgi:hypothetical protein
MLGSEDISPTSSRSRGYRDYKRFVGVILPVGDAWKGGLKFGVAELRYERGGIVGSMGRLGRGVDGESDT